MCLWIWSSHSSDLKSLSFSKSSCTCISQSWENQWSVGICSDENKKMKNKYKNWSVTTFYYHKKWRNMVISKIAGTVDILWKVACQKFYCKPNPLELKDGCFSKLNLTYVDKATCSDLEMLSNFTRKGTLAHFATSLCCHVWLGFWNSKVLFF